MLIKMEEQSGKNNSEMNINDNTDPQFLVTQG
jgi:hypothetical protein